VAIGPAKKTGSRVPWLHTFAWLRLNDGVSGCGNRKAVVDDLWVPAIIAGQK